MAAPRDRRILGDYVRRAGSGGNPAGNSEQPVPELESRAPAQGPRRWPLYQSRRRRDVVPSEPENAYERPLQLHRGTGPVLRNEAGRNLLPEFRTQHGSGRTGRKRRLRTVAQSGGSATDLPIQIGARCARGEPILWPARDGDAGAVALPIDGGLGDVAETVSAVRNPDGDVHARCGQ